MQTDNTKNARSWLLTKMEALCQEDLTELCRIVVSSGFVPTEETPIDKLYDEITNAVFSMNLKDLADPLLFVESRQPRLKYYNLLAEENFGQRDDNRKN